MDSLSFAPHIPAHKLRKEQKLRKEKKRGKGKKRSEYHLNKQLGEVGVERHKNIIDVLIVRKSNVITRIP